MTGVIPRTTRRSGGASLPEVAVLAGLMLSTIECAAPAPPVRPPPVVPPVVHVPPCPEEMALITGPKGDYCIDRYEASLVRRGGPEQAWPGNQPIDGNEAQLVAVSRAGQKPQGYISGEQAAVACQHAGKRLCSAEEWVTACRGPENHRYPYGPERRANVCNDRFGRPTRHPVLRLFKETAPRGTSSKAMWRPSFMNDPRLHELDDTVKETGAMPGCTNEFGVYDMVGNLHEWVADRRGTFLGGFFMDTRINGEGCEYRTTAHSYDYHDYSTGFRCCADAQGSPRRAAPGSSRRAARR